MLKMKRKEFLFLLDQIMEELSPDNYSMVLQKYFDRLLEALIIPIQVHHMMESLYSFKMTEISAAAKEDGLKNLSEMYRDQKYGSSELSNNL